MGINVILVPACSATGSNCIQLSDVVPSSSGTMPEDINPSPPQLVTRWMRPQSSSAVLELPTAPVTISVQKDKDISWHPFTEEESSECETAWQNLSEEERQSAENDEHDNVSKSSEDIDDEDDDIVGVSIAKDKLFEVDVRSMRLRPIYWKMNAPPIKVIRGTWFYDDHRPVAKDLSKQLEELYLHVKPWLPSYEIELQTAFELGLDAHAKLKQQIDETHSVVFETSSLAYIVPNSGRRFFSFLQTSGSQQSTLTFYPGSVAIFRGYDAAVSYTKAQTRPRSSSVPAKRKVTFEETGYQSDNSIVFAPQQEDHEIKHTDRRGRQRRASEWNKSAVGNDDSEDSVTDLILIIHGIGQGLAAQYEGYNFVYAVNLFRQIARRQSTTPALASIMRDRRVQFLPVQWRTNFILDKDEELRREDAGLDNEFTLNDITIKNTVPYVRDLMNNVLIDIPYFMSHHKEKMIKAVVQQANRIFRLWCARNPGFDEFGRVHILAHSLGSSLAGHILSNQPTIQPPLSHIDPDYVKECTEQFLFNTSSLFLIGSPFPLFVHINRTQVIARKGRERTMNSPPDEALDKVGIFGCLAVDSLYNIFAPSDPIAYLLNPTVDSRRARELPPSVIKNVNTPLFTSFSTRVTRLWEGVVSTSPRSRSPSRPPMPHKVSGGFELGGPVEVVEGTKEERRFLALNPRGNLDYALPSEGNISTYLDMITAHSSYWSDSNLAAFMLAEIFARKEDLARTGLGVEISETKSSSR